MVKRAKKKKTAKAKGPKNKASKSQTLKSVASKSKTVRKAPAMTLKDVHTAPGHLIRRAQQIAVAIFLDEFSEHNITPVQYASLFAIRDMPGMEQKTLVDQIAIDRSTTGSLLRLLEKAGRIVRVTPEENLRVRQLYITEKGEELLDSTIDNLNRAQERILAPLKKEDREVFMKLLSRIVNINNRFSRVPMGSTRSMPNNSSKQRKRSA